MSAPERIMAWPSFGPNSVTGEWSANTHYDERAEEYIRRNGETVATLIAQARAEALEEAAVIADDINGGWGQSEYEAGMDSASSQIAAAIRARKDEA